MAQGASVECLTDGKKRDVFMGSYGLGVNRTMATLAELYHDEYGLRWPRSVAPFDVHIVTRSDRDSVVSEAERVYTLLSHGGIDVLLDDRSESAGVKLADADLLGIPNRIVVSAKSLEKRALACKRRAEQHEEEIGFDAVLSWCTGASDV